MLEKNNITPIFFLKEHNPAMESVPLQFGAAKSGDRHGLSVWVTTETTLDGVDMLLIEQVDDGLAAGIPAKEQSRSLPVTEAKGKQKVKKVMNI